jgi:NAD(P)-dependent dehydrogenase (short-subunit alcohol dehydrogenase family)
MVYDLKSRNVLVTGGSRGLGAVIVERFAKEGANIVINYISSASAAEALTQNITLTYGIKAVAIRAYASHPNPRLQPRPPHRR